MNAYLHTSTTVLERLLFARVPINESRVSIEYGEFVPGQPVDAIRRAADRHLLLLCTPKHDNPLLTWAHLTERLQAFGFEPQARGELILGGSRCVSFVSRGRHKPWTRLSGGTDPIDAWVRMGESDVLGVLGLPQAAISTEAVERMTSAIARVTAETLFPLGREVDALASETAKAFGAQVASAQQTLDDLEKGAEDSAAAASQQATNLSRDYVLAQPALSSEEIHDRFGGGVDSKNKNDMAKRLRQSGQVLGIWNGRKFRHPLFQFTPSGPDARFAELLGVLPVHENDRTGWRRAFWLYFPNELLDDREPAAVWAEDPRRVLDAAREEFEASDDDA